MTEDLPGRAMRTYIYEQVKSGPGCQELTKYIRHSEYRTIAHTPVLRFFYIVANQPHDQRI